MVDVFCLGKGASEVAGHDEAMLKHIALVVPH